MKRFIRFAGRGLQAFEFVVFVCAAIAFVAIGPVIWSYRLFTTDRFAGAVAVAALWLVSVAMVAREILSKAITAVSLGIFVAWVVVLVWYFTT